MSHIDIYIYKRIHWKFGKAQEIYSMKLLKILN